MKYFVKIVWTIFLKKENISIRMLRIMGYYICFWNKEILLDRKNTREWIYFGQFNQRKRRFRFKIFRKLEINSNDCAEKTEDFCD